MRSFLCFLLVCLVAVHGYECPSGYSSGSYFDNNYVDREYCYKMYMTFFDRHQAAAQCLQDGATLATIASEEVNNLLVGADQKSGSVTFGLTCHNGNECVFYDGTPFNSTSFNKFIKGHPNTAYGECVALQTLGDIAGQWTNVPCSTYGAFVCHYNPNTLISQQSGCNSLYLLDAYGSNMKITSPHYPNNYDNYQTCSYFIKFTYGKGMNITFTDFYTESTFDVVRIFSGGYRNNTAYMGTYTGQLGNFTVQVNDTEALMTFTSDGSNVYRGFSANVHYNY